MRAIYVTSDVLDPNTGAGKVCLHEINALSFVFERVDIISRSDVPGPEYYDSNPFLFDYFAARRLANLGLEFSRASAAIGAGDWHVDLVHMSCSPGMAIYDTVSPEHFVTNVVAHDLALSIEEHERYYGKGTYPFVHNTNAFLHDALLKHSRLADRVITPSMGAARWIRENPDTEGARVTVIPHGTEIPPFVAPLPDTFRPGYLGAFGPDKGLLYLLMAWQHFSYPGTLVFGGRCESGIHWLADRFKIPLPAGNRYVFTGWLDHVSSFYNQISVYVQPSVSEGFGIELLEAMAYGRPIIATTGTAAPDIITDGVEGFIVPPRDPAAILDRLSFMRNHPDSVAIMGAAAREKAKHYSWSDVEAAYVNLYREILGIGS